MHRSVHRALAGLAIGLPASGVALGAQPAYEITNLGVVNAGDFASQGLGVSPGGVAVGASFGSEGQGFTYTSGDGLVPLPNDPDKPFGEANGANDAGTVVGTGADTSFGAGAVPLRWNNGSVQRLPLGQGFSVGRAHDVNGADVAVGSNGGGIDERAAYWQDESVSVITEMTPGGSSMTTAFAVNNAGRAVGIGTDPGAPARNVPLVYDTGSGTLTEIQTLPGDNGGIAFDVSEGGHVVGSSSQNQAGGTPFIWDDASGASEIPLPAGTSTGSARGVNSDGWAVGVGSGQFAVPFLFDGDQTHRLQDLLPEGTGWDLSMNTSSAALGLSEDGTIVGTGLIDGDIRAFQMTIIPAPGTAAALLIGGGSVLLGRRRRGS